ncbi:MAG: hypothetical protein SPH48_05785 [Sodaliphilus sp.]|nr:hypothetical protein [Sodaliphilus sp.]
MSKQVAKSHGVVQASVAFLCIGAKALAPPLIAPHGKHNCPKHGQSKTINKIFICHGAAYRLLCLSLHFKQYYNN